MLLIYLLGKDMKRLRFILKGLEISGGKKTLKKMFFPVRIFTKKEASPFEAGDILQ